MDVRCSSSSFLTLFPLLRVQRGEQIVRPTPNWNVSRTRSPVARNHFLLCPKIYHHLRRPVSFSSRARSLPAKKLMLSPSLLKQMFATFLARQQKLNSVMDFECCCEQPNSRQKFFTAISLDAHSNIKNPSQTSASDGKPCINIECYFFLLTWSRRPISWRRAERRWTWRSLRRSRSASAAPSQPRRDSAPPPSCPVKPCNCIILSSFVASLTFYVQSK